MLHAHKTSCSPVDAYATQLQTHSSKTTLMRLGAKRH